MIKMMVLLEALLKRERWLLFVATVIWIGVSLFMGHLMYGAGDIAPNYTAYIRSMVISFGLIYITVQSFKEHRKQNAVRRGRK